MKCKDCGAHLPYGAYGHIRCEFCNTPNYVPIPGEKPEAEEKKEAKKEPAIKKDTQKGSSIKGLVKKIIIIGILFTVVLVIIGMMVTPSPDPPEYTYTPKPTYYTPTTTRPLTTTTPPPTTTVPRVSIVSDSFNSNVNGWAMGSSSGEYATHSRSLINGKYHWVAEAHKGFTSTVRPNIETLSDLHLKVEAQLISGPENAAYGVILRRIDGNYYRFAINDNQKYTFLLLYKDEWIKLIDWTTSSSIRPGQVNKIEVIAEGSHFILQINNQFINDVYDDRLTSGKPGLSISLYNAGDIGVFEFDNFKISTSAPPTTTPAPTTKPPIMVYDAIDILPEHIEGYTTEELEKQIMTQEDLEDLDNCGRTSATAGYVNIKNENVLGYVIALECDSEEDAIWDLFNLATILEQESNVTFSSEITLEKNINAEWAWTTDDVSSTAIFIWSQNNFLIMAMGFTEAGEDPFDVGRYIANSVILQSPL